MDPGGLDLCNANQRARRVRDTSTAPSGLSESSLVRQPLAYTWFLAHWWESLPRTRFRRLPLSNLDSPDPEPACARAPQPSPVRGEAGGDTRDLAPAPPPRSRSKHQNPHTPSSLLRRPLCFSQRAVRSTDVEKANPNPIVGFEFSQFGGLVWLLLPQVCLGFPYDRLTHQKRRSCLWADSPAEGAAGPAGLPTRQHN